MPDLRHVLVRVENPAHLAHVHVHPTLSTAQHDVVPRENEHPKDQIRFIFRRKANLDVQG